MEKVYAKVKAEGWDSVSDIITPATSAINIRLHLNKKKY